MGRLQALLVNIRRGWKLLEVKDDLAYNASQSFEILRYSQKENNMLEAMIEKERKRKKGNLDIKEREK